MQLYPQSSVNPKRKLNSSKKSSKTYPNELFFSIFSKTFEVEKSWESVDQIQFVFRLQTNELFKESIEKSVSNNGWQLNLLKLGPTSDRANSDSM